MKTSFETTYTENYKTLVRIACSYVGNIMEAEDIVQEVFMHIWIRMKLKNDLGNNDFEGLNYVIVSVKNKCLDYLRMKSRVNSVCYSDNEPEMNMIAEHIEYYDTEEVKHRDELDVKCKISDAINNLPSKCRQIFIEKRIKGEKQVNIAIKHNISLKTIEKQMNIAYKKLRVELSCLVGSDPASILS